MKNDGPDTGGKAILVTGASSGIGRATAIQLAAAGHTVFAAARRLDRLTELARTTPGTVIPVRLDVRDPESVRAAVATVAETCPDGLDVLVNNAGYALIGPAETLSTEGVRAQFETNVIGLLDVTRAFLPQMRARRSGRIVNISSLLGAITVPGSGIYGGSKHAVEALSDALRMELKQFGVEVVVVQPSFASTDIDVTQHMASGGGAIAEYAPLERQLTAYLDEQMQKAVSGEVVAACVVHASTTARPKARYVTPQREAVTLGLLTALPTRLTDALKLRLVRGAAA
ncbi:SDR family oxidoreductase [Paraconexibacter antarcticus]|uniref:SDR family oxidoreductase n=1 Tax=Paraconexibacter antarcticus TaxID=2949664 RepID=A0ABY5DTF4_9ACTN|nr:SDR family oxidoreductase [Paraconexibacter antarcticus]UTI65313.1 SDR family oxidoreductase [Paraconexibacter antarcticus]